MEDTNESEVTEVKDDNADRAEEEASTYNTHSPGAHKMTRRWRTQTILK